LLPFNSEYFIIPLRTFGPEIEKVTAKLRKLHNTMKNAVFWEVAPCRSCVNRRFGGMYRLYLLGIKIRERGNSVSRWLQIAVTAVKTSNLTYIIRIHIMFFWNITQCDLVGGYPRFTGTFTLNTLAAYSSKAPVPTYQAIRYLNVRP
jgi:hypothetical protein